MATRRTYSAESRREAIRMVVEHGRSVADVACSLGLDRSVVGSNDPGWQGRAHFFGAAARAMRHVVTDHLRRKRRLKRGGDFRRVGEHTAAGLSCNGPSDDVLDVEMALTELEVEYPRRAEVVALSFYGELTAAEIAEVLGLTTRTVERDWQFAKAWMNGRLAGPEDSQ